jgi:hypothetical protein
MDQWAIAAVEYEDSETFQTKADCRNKCESIKARMPGGIVYEDNTGYEIGDDYAMNYTQV